MLVELFYLPYHHGPLAQHLLEHFRWLRANSLSVGIPAMAPDGCGVRLVRALLRVGACRSCGDTQSVCTSTGHAVAGPSPVLPAALRSDVPPAQPLRQQRRAGTAVRPSPLPLGHPQHAAGHQRLRPLAGYVAGASPVASTRTLIRSSHAVVQGPQALWHTPGI